MMKVIRVALLLLAMLAPPSWAGQESNVYRLRVDGLACPFCAYGVEKMFNAVDGVARLDIDINAGVVSVTMAGRATLDEATAKQIVKDAGFTLRGFERGRVEAAQ